MSPRPYAHLLAESDKIWGAIPDRDRKVLMAVQQHYALTPSPLKATTLFNQSTLGSPVPIYESIKRLTKGGYLRLSPDRMDQRVKHLSIATKGLKLLDRLDALVLAASQ